MGVYINMEMPEKEGVALFLYPGGRVNVWKGNAFVGHEYAAVPVRPHGRLGDLDKQDVQIEALIERHLHGYTKSTWDFVCELRDILKRNITIIPASEDGE